MRQISISAAIFFLLLGGGSALAQHDPYGAIDSVTIASLQVPLGSSFKLAVQLVNDEEISAFSIPLNYNKALLVYDSTSFANSRACQWSYLQASHNPANGTILLGGLSINDPMLPGGSGILFELFFHTAAGATPGSSSLIDSAFVPPAGEFILSSFESTIIRPAFRQGTVTIGGADQPPVFTPLSRQIVNEGETLDFMVQAADPEGQPVALVAVKLPPGLKFTDHGNGSGSFSLAVPFVGPGSAKMSPYEIIIAASDGNLSSYLDVVVEVVNINRPPQFIGSFTYDATAGDSVYLPIVATDPDFEKVTLQAHALPAGAQLSLVSPGYLVWGSSIADSGSHQFTIVATDESGGVTSRQITLDLIATQVAELTITEEQAFSGTQVEVTISMLNRVDISGFGLLLKYDQTLLSLDNVTSTGTRTETWEKFSAVIHDSDGRVWINAASDSAGTGAGALLPGNGVVAKLQFWTSSDLSYAGYHSGIDFEFLDPQQPSDNVLYTPDGAIVDSSLIRYFTGGVLIKAHDGLIGDLNLNGIAFEVADLVYFFNYFIDPFNYPLDGDRWYNSDINQDGQPGTLADLVYMEAIMNGGGAKLLATESDLIARYNLTTTGGEIVYALSSEVEIAAAFFKFATGDGGPLEFHPAAALAGMDVRTGVNGDTLRVLVIGPAGNTFAANGQELFRLAGSTDIRLVSQACVDSRARELYLERARRESCLPSQYSLNQNYPNPFNPQTLISFDLPKAGQVRLAVYNLLGEKVRVLINEYLPAGQHQVVFDGRNSYGEALASGVYFYRLSADRFKDTKKMLLLK